MSRIFLLRGCFKEQRYKFLKAIHNLLAVRLEDFRGCFKEQRYKFLKAIHNLWYGVFVPSDGCFKEQRYKFLKAIHNFFKYFMVQSRKSCIFAVSLSMCRC